MPRKESYSAVNENWIKKETKQQHYVDAILAAKKHAKSDEDKINAGYKQISVPHPTSPRAIILKWVKI